MPVFIVSFRGVATVIAILFCLGAAPRITVVVLVFVLLVRLWLWAQRVVYRWESWKYRKNNY